MMADQEESGWSEKKWLAIIGILAFIYIAIWVLYFLGLIKPIY